MENRQTAVEWLEKQLTDAPYIHFGDLFEQAKEMEKQQIKDAWNNGAYCGDMINIENSQDYFVETYGSKGSDEYPTLEGTINLCNDIIKKKTGKMTEEEWQAAERAQTSSKIEISDEDIEIAAANAYNTPHGSWGFRAGANWCREQLKKK